MTRVGKKVRLVPYIYKDILDSRNGQVFYFEEGTVEKSGKYQQFWIKADLPATEYWEYVDEESK